MTRVQLDGGLNGLTSSGSWGSSIGSRDNSGQSRCSSIGGRGNSSQSMSSICGSRESISISSTIVGSSRESITIRTICGSWESIGISSISFSFSISRSFSLGGGSIKKFEELSLGSSNLRSINNRGRGDSGIDRGNRKNTRVDRSNRQVVSSHTETKVISNIVDSVDSSLILVSVRSSNSTISITLLLLGTVDVVVTISNVAKFILGLELGAYWASNRSR